MTHRIARLRTHRLAARSAPWRALLALGAAGLAASLAGCLGNSGSPQAPPSGVQAYAGDAQVSVVWNQDPLVSYWLFYAQDPTITPDAITLNSNLLNLGVIEPASSPVILCNGTRLVINNSPASDPGFPPIYFTINGRTGTAKGGPGSAPVAVTPRPAAGPGVPWVAGNAFPGPVTSLGYVPISPCGYASAPAEGLFLAVGPSATVYSSKLTPSVAGSLNNPGNQIMSWVKGNVPLGFNQNLNAVAGESSGDPANPTLLLTAVGDNGAILRSTDGQNWTLAVTVPTGISLHDVAATGSGFIAVGDNGVVLTSPDALHWTLSEAAQLANPAATTLRAIRCAGATCFAVGDSGTTLLTTSGGGTWSLIVHGTNNWVGVAYGNQDANRQAVVTHPNGNVTITIANEAIGTWVIVDAGGNYAYFNGASGGTWASGTTLIAPNIVAIEYTSNFVALDAAGNAWLSENGSTDPWATYGSAPVTTGNAQAVAMRSNGAGFVALGAGGANAANF